MIANNKSHIEKYIHPSSACNENTEPTLELLKAISYARQKYFESMEDMYEKISDVGFSELELEEIADIFQMFPMFAGIGKDAKKISDLEFHFQRCVSSLGQLKRNPNYGEIYYYIIVKKIIEKSKVTNEEIAHNYHISLPTFYIRRREAINYTYQIWFGEGMNELIKLSADISELSKKVICKNTNDN